MTGSNANKIPEAPDELRIIKAKYGYSETENPHTIHTLKNVDRAVHRGIWRAERVPVETGVAKSQQISDAPPKGDEQVVNFALVIFLDVLTLPIWRNITSWTLPIRVCTSDIRSEQYDRPNRWRCKDEGFSITEVKRGFRTRRFNPIILYQEAAEMICWIMHDTRPSNERQVPLPKGW
ncbi:hypothetical protein N7481_004751 [Penicillium waksmanii]|uniref:uncharacterized protein n=1 Tax=Penicillium waksmanii TaxID=69791 RepID=UPI00254793AB|nr:uncharacterized protein N7481_004751 [Penicillium waksmanii]KAJ5989541.1 hypothetical protein N7481_004751 [Penicillium waksmanii]